MAGLTDTEAAQLAQTIEMFEVITQSQPLDYQSLEILKEAYFKLDRQKDVVRTSKRIAEAYVQLGQLSSAILEYESILQRFPDDPDVKTALAEIENRASNFGSQVQELRSVDEEQTEDADEAIKELASANLSADKIDDGRKMMSKIFVDGKLLSKADFEKFWVSPNVNSPALKVTEPFIQVISDKVGIRVEESIQLLCERSRCGYLPIESYDIDIELAKSFPKDVCRRWCILPFDRMSKTILIATANPFNKQAVKDMEQATNSRLLWYISPPSELHKTVSKLFR